MTTPLSTNPRPDAADRHTAGPPSTARAAILGRWPSALGILSVLLIFGDGDVDSIDGFAAVLVLMPVAYLLFGWARGELGETRQLAIQLAGLVVFSALAAEAVMVGGTAGRYVVAAGWLGHAAWDLFHHRTGRVVPRAYAEWCLVVDALGAAALVAL